MRMLTAELLLVAAYTHSVFAAVRFGIYNRQIAVHRLSNTTTTPSGSDTARSLTLTTSSASTIELSATVKTPSSAVFSEGEVSQSSAGILKQDPTSAITENHYTSTIGQLSPGNATSTSRLSDPGVISSTVAFTLASSTSLSTDPGLSANRVIRPPTTPVVNGISSINTTRGSDLSTTSSLTHSPTLTWTSWNATHSTEPSLFSTSGAGACTELQGDDVVTEYSIVFTATTTLYGNYSHYTPPYPTIEIPTYCGTGSTLPSQAQSSDKPILSKPGGFIVSSGFIVSTKQPAEPGSATATETFKNKQSDLSLSWPELTVTFVTTDKNPAVVYPTESAPAYGRAGSLTVAQHKTVRPDGQSDGTSKGEDHDDSQDHQDEAPKTTTTSFAITARADQVIINGETFSGLGPDQTTTVTLSRGTFTIYPTEVVGEGATVKKLQPAGTAITVVTPTTTTVGDLAVEVSGSEAVVDGTRITIPPLGTTTVIDDESVSVGPGKLVVDDQTLTFRAVGGYQTDIVIQGGEMVTAVGQSNFVFQSTTITYGPGLSETSEVIDDDTITVGPSGIIFHGTTLGGPSAEATDTTSEIVGGATITKVAPSYVVIDGTTFTAGPGSKWTTKTIGGETITIGPGGVVISSATLSVPFGSSTTTTVKATIVETSTLPTDTGTLEGSGKSSNDEDNAGSILGRHHITGMAGLCIITGVWVWL